MTGAARFAAACGQSQRQPLTPLVQTPKWHRGFIRVFSGLTHPALRRYTTRRYLGEELPQIPELLLRQFRRQLATVNALMRTTFLP